MTTIAAGRLNDTLQTLVDARLDTIDRMLLGRVNRQDRLSIVREVETQIFDLLGSRDSESLDREDVLAVLARLDPPEAYLAEETIGEVGPVRVAMPSRSIRPATTNPGRTGLASGIMGIIALVLVPLTALLAVGGAFNTSVIGFYSLVGLVFILGLLAVILAARARLRDAWAVVGLVTGIISLCSSVFGGLTG